MNPRKISVTVLKRSVFKNIKKRNPESVSVPYVGMDCAVMKNVKDYTYVTVNPVICGERYCEMGIIKAANNISCMGGNIRAVLVNVMFGAGYDEKQLKSIMKRLEAMCDVLDIQIAGGHTCVMSGLSQAVISITGMGDGDDAQSASLKRITPGEDIVITKTIGMEGSEIIADMKEEELKARFSQQFVDSLKYSNEDFLILSEAAVAIKHGVTAMHDLSEGGIFAALWDICEASGKGISIDIKKIPVKQALIEACELYDLNPYELISGGSLLLVTKNGNELVQSLKESGIRAEVIGKTTDTNDKIILNGDEIRYLDTPSRDEIYKILG